MRWEPNDLFKKLEFDKVLELLGEYCLGELGKKEVNKIVPGTGITAIERKLKEVHEFKQTIEQSDWFPLSTYNDVSEELKMLAIEDYVLSEEAIKNINRVLKLVKNIFSFFNNSRKINYSNLYAIIQSLDFDAELIKAIEKVIDEEGNIRPDASPELARIRKMIGSKQRELDKQFRLIIHQYRSKGWLSENTESFRNGRRVLSVPAEHKRKIKGIIHDESTTGRTAFIEPEAIIEINNDIFDLETEERKEIYRILKELSALLRPYGNLIKIYQKIIIQFDIIQAKARLAQLMDAEKPKLHENPTFKIFKGFHPLLLVKNDKANKKTIPFSLIFKGDNRILVLSGPNAGGKSITMKSVGLMQLMVQSGMLIPADKESEFGIFKNIFADIGDQQSIEDDLSTYSSRLKNMRTFLKYSNAQSLVLIDEFGSGTDPKIGGAIAEAILREFTFKKVFAVITTHYSNLKIFAFKTKGIINGSMTFDKDTLSPTYELKVGRPGSSYAFEIGQKSGLNPKILKYAKMRTGKNEKAVDELLVELQNDKQVLEQQIKDLSEKEQKLSLLIKNYESLFKELEYQRKKFKLETKQTALQETIKQNRSIEKTIREIKENQNLDAAKRLSIQYKDKRKQLSEEVSQINDDLYEVVTEKVVDDGQPLTTGDYVKLKSGGATGKIESISKNKAIVQIGDLRMTAKLRDLIRAKAPLQLQRRESVSTDMIQYSAKFDSKIDIRGLRMEEAVKMVEDFVDKALVSNSPNLRIIHGKGNGILRKAVRKKLKEYNVEMEISHPHPDDGGDGVTIVDIV